MRNAYNIWAVMNKNGYGIDPRHGMQVTPVLFPSEDSAKDYLELCKKKFAGVGKIYQVKVTVVKSFQ